MEFIKNACQNTTKKLVATLISPGLGHDPPAREKRLVSKIFIYTNYTINYKFLIFQKKMPDYLLAMAMLDNGTSEEDNLLR